MSLVPLHWYDEYDHIGYDRSGGKVMKRADGTGNGIDAALNARDDPNYARTVYDAYNDREVSECTWLAGGVGTELCFVPCVSVCVKLFV